MKQLLKLLLSGFCLLNFVGCTLYPDKKLPKLEMTTSAEQHERIFWELARKHEWNKAAPLLSSTAIWTLPGKTLRHDEALAYLQQQQVKEYAVHDMTFQPNGADMTVLYTLEEGFGDGHTQRFTAVSVWQQLNGGLVMILHSEQPQG